MPPHSLGLVYTQYPQTTVKQIGQFQGWGTEEKLEKKKKFLVCFGITVPACITWQHIAAVFKCLTIYILE